jgi:spore maturation protein CgeB
MKKIALLVNYNLYESKRYFVRKFAEALERRDIKPTIIDSGNPDVMQKYSEMLTNPKLTDLTCSFNSMLPLKSGQYLWEISHIPHWGILVDPSFYYRSLFDFPHDVIVSCVDHFDCEFARASNFPNVFFWGHAVERELSFSEDEERPYDVVFIGSCYDHKYLQKCWRKVNPRPICEVIENAVEIVLGDNSTPLIAAVGLALAHQKIDPHTVDLDRIFRYVDNYMRGKDRYELICAIKDVNVHVFGGTCWREEQPIEGWSQNLASQPNVTIHPALSFEESLAILKQSKICLNSMPFFKNGTHERIFTGPACGALPITTDNLWVRANFVDGEDIVLYQSQHWDQVNDKVHFYLNHENIRQELTHKAREKVMREHTWDVRVDQFLKEITPILRSMGHFF